MGKSRFIWFIQISIYLTLGHLWAGELSSSDQDSMVEMQAELEILKEEVATTKALVTQEKANIFNPSISVIGDFVGQYCIGTSVDHDEHDHEHDHDHEHSHGHDDNFKNGVFIREIEVELMGAVDPWADALVAIAFENLGQEHAAVHLEEAYARFKQWPGMSSQLFGIELKIGRFMTAFGRMNRLHPHNINQINYPWAIKRFLGSEGFNSQGISLNTSFGLGNKSAISLFAEGVMGSKTPFMTDGAEKIPQGIAHVWWHQELAMSNYFDLGMSSLFGRRGDKDSGLIYLGGIDVHYSYIPAGFGQDPVFLLGNEFFIANPNSKSTHWPVGNFTWAQVRLASSIFLGGRYDLMPKEEELSKLEHALSGYLSYYTTEFLRFRAGYEHVMPNIRSFSGDHRLMLSMIFVLGAHPVEPYYANR